MHRETLIAIGIGLSFGLLVAIGFYQFRRVVNPDSNQPMVVQPTITQSNSTENQTTTIALSSPNEGAVVSSASIKLTGKLNSPVTLLLFSPKLETILAQPANEDFSIDLPLQPGPNILTLLAINETGQTEILERLVVYDNTADEATTHDEATTQNQKEDEKDLADSDKTATNQNQEEVLSPTSTSTTRALLQRINQRLDPDQSETPVQTALDKLRRAYLGQVDRITDEAIRLQTRTQPISLPISKLSNLRLGEKKIEANQIEVENWLLIIGALAQPDNLDSLEPEKTLVYTKSPRSLPPFATLGSLESLTKSQLQIVERSSGESSTFNLAPSIKYLDSEGKTTAANNFTADTGVLIAGYIEDDKRVVTTIRALAPFVKEAAGE